MCVTVLLLSALHPFFQSLDLPFSVWFLELILAVCAAVQWSVGANAWPGCHGEGRSKRKDEPASLQLCTVSCPIALLSPSCRRRSQLPFRSVSQSLSLCPPPPPPPAPPPPPPLSLSLSSPPPPPPPTHPPTLSLSLSLLVLPPCVRFRVRQTEEEEKQALVW